MYWYDFSTCFRSLLNLFFLTILSFVIIYILILCCTMICMRFNSIYPLICLLETSKWWFWTLQYAQRSKVELRNVRRKNCSTFRSLQLEYFLPVAVLRSCGEKLRAFASAHAPRGGLLETCKSNAVVGMRWEQCLCCVYILRSGLPYSAYRAMMIPPKRCVVWIRM